VNGTQLAVAAILAAAALVMVGVALLAGNRKVDEALAPLPTDDEDDYVDIDEPIPFMPVAPSESTPLYDQVLDDADFQLWAIELGSAS
jgi:hypothetical protein